MGISVSSNANWRSAMCLALVAASATLSFSQSAQNESAPNGSVSAAHAGTTSSSVLNEGAMLKSAESFVRTLFAWGPEFQVKLGPLEQSMTPDFYRVPLVVTFNGQSESGDVFMSKDGKTLFRGEMFDMAVDPFAVTRAKLKLDGDPSRGPADAKVTILEFSDFQCPHCRQLYKIMQAVEQKYPQVRVIHKDFPLSAIHPWAMTAAVGARCAFAQSSDGFWAVHDLIFENQDLISSENVYQKMIDFTVRAGLDKDAFKSCMASPDPKAAIQADLDEGKAVQITSTPTVFVNGRPLAGGDEATLEQYIQFELGPQEKKKPASVTKPGTAAAQPKK